MEQQQNQHILDLPKVIAGAIASPLAALATSRFGVAGTMIGLTLTAVIVTVIADALKFYLARVPGAVTSIPGGFKKKSAWGRFLVRLRLPFSKLSSIPPARRRSLLIRSVIGGAIVFVIGLVIVTGVELSVGKNLSCWVWDNCYTESSAEGENASDTSSLPSIFIASNSISTSAPQVSPSAPQQQPVSAPPSPLPPTPPSSPSSSGNGSQPSVSEQPSVLPGQQQSSSSGEYQQQSDYQQQGEYQQSPSGSSENQPQSPLSEPQGQQRRGGQNESPNPPSSEWEW